ncbi:MAG: hypothetical protein LBO80_10860 [Treponema sp.]|jgi:hypothetical protein|nr:hypothetical protein [Treponema sp.]
MKLAKVLFLVFIVQALTPVLIRGEPLVSPTWGFRIDPPEGYAYVDGDGMSRFSFQSPQGASLDLAVYGGSVQAGNHNSVRVMAEDIQKRLNNRGTVNYFNYHNKEAALVSLDFGLGGAAREGWALCIELGGETRPLLLALAYGPKGQEKLKPLHLSALDSICPTEKERRNPGPVTEFNYPRGELIRKPLPNLGVEALVYEHDAEAAQALVDREFEVLKHYLDSSLWKEAWIRFYRAIYRDSYDRLADAAFMAERAWYKQAAENTGPSLAAPDLAGRAVRWVQSFAYERNFLGSDFINLVSAAFEGRGDCDSRALLWAIVLEQANIPAAIMVSREYRHAMGLADLAGTGGRFELGGKKWLVAETTAPVSLGLIAESFSVTDNWLGILFE